LLRNFQPLEIPAVHFYNRWKLWQRARGMASFFATPRPAAMLRENVAPLKTNRPGQRTDRGGIFAGFFSTAYGVVLAVAGFA
jgi:hypothetical protein